MVKLFKHWFNEPIIVPRWLLVLQYMFFIVLGAAIAVSTHTVFQEAVPSSWTDIWASGVSLSAIGSLIGSLHARWEVVERWSAMVLCSLLIGYALAPIEFLFQGDSTRTAYSVMAIMLALLPAVRTGFLIRRTGLPHGRK